MLKSASKYLKRKWANVSFTNIADLRLGRPAVSFTFDDAPASAFENGGEILHGNGYGGTFYISLSFLRPETSAATDAFFTRSLLKWALDQNHELGCHTYSHIDISTTPLAASVRDIERNREEFRKLFPGDELHDFSYPFGSQTRSIKKYLASTCLTARGIQPGINIGRTDLLNLKAVQLYERKNDLPHILHLLQNTIEKKGWLIFYTHDVKPDFSPWGCSPEYFAQVVEACKTLNLEVLTVNQVMAGQVGRNAQ